MSTAADEQRTWMTTTSDGDIGVLTYEALNPGAIEALVQSPKAGAVVTFTGYTRDSFEDKVVTHLEYETYPSLALKTLSAVLQSARSLPAPSPSEPHPGCHQTHHTPSTSIEVTRIAAYHLLGPSPVGTASIVIAVASPHRKEAFVVCEYVLEEVKKKVQVWKREFYQPEEKGGPGEVFVGGDGEGPRMAPAGPSAERNEVQGGAGVGDRKEAGWEWKANFSVPPQLQEGGIQGWVGASGGRSGIGAEPIGLRGNEVDPK